MSIIILIICYIIGFYWKKTKKVPENTSLNVFNPLISLKIFFTDPFRLGSSSCLILWRGEFVMSMNHWIDQAEILAIKTLKEQGKTPDMFSRAKAHVGQSGSIMFSPIPWSGNSDADNIISAAATLLTCCKFIRQPENQSNPIKAMAAGRYIGRIMLALAISGDDSIPPEIRVKIIREASSKNGRKALNKPKTWYSDDLNKMIRALLLRKNKQGKDVFHDLTFAPVVGRINSIEHNPETNKITIYPTMTDDYLGEYMTPPPIGRKAIEKRASKINKST